MAPLCHSSSGRSRPPSTPPANMEIKAKRGLTSPFSIPRAEAGKKRYGFLYRPEPLIRQGGYLQIASPALPVCGPEDSHYSFQSSWVKGLLTRRPCGEQGRSPSPLFVGALAAAPDTSGQYGNKKGADAPFSIPRAKAGKKRYGFLCRPEPLIRQGGYLQIDSPALPVCGRSTPVFSSESSWVKGLLSRRPCGGQGRSPSSLSPLLSLPKFISF